MNWSVQKPSVVTPLDRMNTLPSMGCPQEPSFRVLSYLICPAKTSRSRTFAANAFFSSIGVSTADFARPSPTISLASKADLKKRNAQIVLLASGDEPFNREHAARHGLHSPILLTKERGIPEPFKHQGTPVAYFVDEQGQVAAPFASGIDQVLALAERVANSADEPIERKPARSRLTSERSLSESRIERNGLKAGTPAPRFRLPDLQGQPVALDDYRGRQVLLVFSDPHCGPCDELAPHLARLHQEHRDNGLAVILVGRGSEEENRNKAEKFGFQFPVVLQDRWKLSKEYGIFATPVAFLIAENGVIARDVAVGKDAILALAADAVTLEEKTAQ